jgi:hypothetical protein
MYTAWAARDAAIDRDETMTTTMPKTIKKYSRYVSCYVDCRRRNSGRIGVQLKSRFVGNDGLSFRTFDSVKDVHNWLIGVRCKSFHNMQDMKKLRRSLGI